MKVTEKDVDYVADLANLELTAEERTHMQKDLNAILGYIDTLAELDITGVEPLVEVASKFAGSQQSGSQKFAYAQRADETRPSLAHDVAMSNAPDTDGTYFKVPRVIEK